MLLAGIITPVEPAWTSPVVIATKKAIFTRFCADYRKLNSVMHTDRWPLPQVNEILDEMRRSSVFTTIDLFQGYWPIEIDENWKETAVFTFRHGLYQFEVMPLGIMNYQAAFQKMMSKFSYKSII